MILKDIPLADRRKLTSHYPVLLASETGTGKSYSFSQLTDEEKARTVIFNFDKKSICEDANDDEVFGKVYYTTDDEKNTQKNYFNLNDLFLIDSICNALISVAAFDKCDRILIDTFTLMTKFINRWASQHFSGFDVWNTYNNGITKVIECVKECAITYGKFIYVAAHYPPRVGMAPNTKRYVTTKGKEHTNIIEESFSTVVETLMEDRQFKYSADIFDETNTTKTKLVEGSFKFVRTSVDDLEQVLTKSKTVVDEKLV